MNELVAIFTYGVACFIGCFFNGVTCFFYGTFIFTAKKTHYHHSHDSKLKQSQ